MHHASESHAVHKRESAVLQESALDRGIAFVEAGVAVFALYPCHGVAGRAVEGVDEGCCKHFIVRYHFACAVNGCSRTDRRKRVKVGVEGFFHVC